MPDAPVELDELLDLKLLPAWVNEPPPSERYAQHQGEAAREGRRRDRRQRKGKRPPRPRDRTSPQPPTEQSSNRLPRDRFHDRKREHGRDRHGKDRHRGPRDRQGGRPFGRNRPAQRPEKPLPKVEVRFLPRLTAFENVVAQINSGTVAYSLFALARLFLEKPTRYQVKLTALPESPLFRLGEDGAVSSDREFLDRSAFRFAKSDFFKIEVTETDPIKGNFTNVARCRLSGTVLGPTNHHDYQRRLRNLYEQRFSRRMSFPEYQHKIEIMSDPAVIEKWKDEARKHTTFATLGDSPQTFSSETDAERHFRQHHLDGLIQNVTEATISISQITDRNLRRVVEDAWNIQTKSPSAMMQELATHFRENGLHIFRHRRGMLFVSPVYPRAIAPDAEVSSQVRAIMEAIAAQPRIGRKELADKLMADLGPEETEKAKLALASDLKWLIDGGHVIEFNDGSLDLPRAKVKPKEKEENVEAAVPAAEKEETVEAGVPAEKEEHVEPGAPPTDESVEAAVSAAQEEPSEIGGS